MIIRQFHLW